MPTLTCPRNGWEHIEITFPDQFTVGDNEKFARAFREVKEDFSYTYALLIGSAAVCTKIEGLDKGSPLDWPLEVVSWMVSEIYTEGLQKALALEKNLSLTSLLTPKA